MSYLLSIAVPTKDRYEYLKPLITLIKSFNSDHIELIIQDNTNNNVEIAEYIKRHNYKHLRYFHTPEQISVSQNCDLAVLNSTGEYVCLLGDDDGVSGHIVSAVKWMKRNEIDVLKTAFNTYKWPSFSFSRIAKLAGVLMTSFYDRKSYEINPSTQLIKMLKTGGSKFRYLPKLYHGIAKRSTLDKIYEIGNTYFPGASPDVANAVALSFVTNKFVFLNFPVIIPGNGNRTGGDVQKHKGLCARISDIPFLPKNTEENWEKFIPKLWSCETIIPESACKALTYMGRNDYIDKHLNKELMVADFVLGHFNERASIKKLPLNKLLIYLLVIKLLTTKILRAVYAKFSMKFFSISYLDGFFKYWIFNKKNYIQINRNLKTINEANAFLIQKEPNFKPRST